jgi:hypothetical protein
MYWKVMLGGEKMTRIVGEMKLDLVASLGGIREERRARKAKMRKRRRSDERERETYPKPWSRRTA